MLTKDKLHELFEYKDGVLYWRVDMHPNKVAGNPVGSITKSGYLETKVYGAPYKVHRLIWSLHFDSNPEMIDHIDGNKTNNDIHNLRESTRSENGFNQKLRKDSTSGIKGVTWNKQSRKWLVQCQVNKRKMYFGIYEDLELAELVAVEARNKYHGEFARHN